MSAILSYKSEQNFSFETERLIRIQASIGQMLETDTTYAFRLN